MKVLSGEGEAQRVLELHQVRHPLVELQESVSYIANDVAFAPATSTLHLITGPNMGGKSTYVRSVGVAVLMAQMGSFIPADAGSKMSVVGKFYLSELQRLRVSKACFFLVFWIRIRIYSHSFCQLDQVPYPEWQK